ncbi:hypothetical protein [Empedobacter sp.]|uniref:hypothetical protein n=1 Tax=Empedobacter sp. TaxID=1927715 RepID=UPI0028A78CEA|nr:hypothetical protein [Empedobacter sp.]
MPIYDINGQTIESFKTKFPNDNLINNIEFGAGKSYYGKKEFPYCFSTDFKVHEISHFSSLPDYDEKTLCHFLDNEECDFFTYNFTRSFSNIIICNPFGYGVRNKPERILFFNRIGNLLEDNGHLHIIGRHNNSFSKKKNVDRFLNREQNEEGSEHRFELVEFNDLDENSYELINYNFNTCIIGQVTSPTEKIKIKKIPYGN